jgi:hypothetical protein
VILSGAGDAGGAPSARLSLVRLLASRAGLRFAGHWARYNIEAFRGRGGPKGRFLQAAGGLDKRLVAAVLLSSLARIGRRALIFGVCRWSAAVAG